MKNKIKILELCHFSAGICGVWTRVIEESKRLSEKGYEVRIMSSNAVKGSDEIACEEESVGKIRIKRFPFNKLGGESFLEWKFEKEALEYSPDIIFAHVYRQIHTTRAIKIANKLKEQCKKCKVFLVTHAPFVEGDITRSFFSKMAVRFYDFLIGPRTINNFDKVIVISNWEIPYLLNIGLKKNKIAYIPNGIPEEFFKIKKLVKEEKKILFLSRISPKKKVETIISAIPNLNDKSIRVEIVGPAEKEYLESIKKLIKKLGVGKRIIFTAPIYDIKKKIKKIDSARVFVLPSRVEGMPQALVEAMARGKAVIGSDSIAIRDLIKDGENGYLFEFNNPISLAEKINLALCNKSDKIGKNAKDFAKKFNWNNVIDRIESLINSNVLHN